MAERGCLMLEPGNVPGFYGAVCSVNEDDVHSKGLQILHPHVTFIFGFTNRIPITESRQLMAEVLEHCPKTLGIDRRPSLFQNEDFDVLKFNVHVPDCLRGYRSRVMSRYDCKQNYPDWIPHLTVGYLKRGTGIKYLGTRFRSDSISIEAVSFNQPQQKQRIVYERD
jgi:hypothetical protein